jgi:hypothetical protein
MTKVKRITKEPICIDPVDATFAAPFLYHLLPQQP